jgi:hypothetical protein
MLIMKFLPGDITGPAIPFDRVRSEVIQIIGFVRDYLIPGIQKAKNCEDAFRAYMTANRWIGGLIFIGKLLEPTDRNTLYQQAQQPLEEELAAAWVYAQSLVGVNTSCLVPNPKELPKTSKPNADPRIQALILDLDSWAKRVASGWQDYWFFTLEEWLEHTGAQMPPPEAPALVMAGEAGPFGSLAGYHGRSEAKRVARSLTVVTNKHEFTWSMEANTEIWFNPVGGRRW